MSVPPTFRCCDSLKTAETITIRQPSSVEVVWQKMTGSEDEDIASAAARNSVKYWINTIPKETCALVCESVDEEIHENLFIYCIDWLFLFLTRSQFSGISDILSGSTLLDVAIYATGAGEGGIPYANESTSFSGYVTYNEGN